MEKAEPTPSFATGSGVRRIALSSMQTIWRKLRPYILATRRKPEGGEKFDGPEMLRRVMLGAMALMIGSVCPWTRPLFGLPSDTQSLQRIEADVASVKQDVRTLSGRVDSLELQVVKGVMDGMRRPR